MLEYVLQYSTLIGGISTNAIEKIPAPLRVIIIASIFKFPPSPPPNLRVSLFPPLLVSLPCGLLYTSSPPFILQFCSPQKSFVHLTNILKLSTQSQHAKGLISLADSCSCPSSTLPSRLSSAFKHAVVPSRSQRGASSGATGTFSSAPSSVI